jgi:acetoin utilization protein AcuC
VSKSVSVVWNDALSAYNFGPTHPFSPIRVALAIRLADELGLLDHSNVTMLREFASATDEQLLTVHTPELLAAVKQAGEDPEHYRGERFGIGTADTPAFRDMHAAAARVVGATLAAAEQVLAGTTEHAVNIAGGLHHGMPGLASGFCVYNDIAVAIRWLLDQGVERIAYLDVDVHHGDGVQAAFWDDPRVLTVSIHESPETLFPGTGQPTEIGGPNALGSKVNIAVPAGTGDQGWLRAFHAVTPHLLREFKPTIIVSQHGCDSHFEDPLANLVVSIDGQRMAADAIHRWAHRYAGGRWLAVGGGGYEWVDVVPRSWTHLIGIAIGKPVPPSASVPLGFHEYVLELLGRQGPVSMTDGFDPWPKNWELGYDPADPVDQAVIATRRAVFPHHGIAVDSWQGF